MSNCARRSIQQPTSYKDFAETGHRHTIPEGFDLDQTQLMEENNEEESRESSSGESQNNSIINGETETNATNTDTSDSEVHVGHARRRTPGHDHDKTTSHADNDMYAKHGKQSKEMNPKGRACAPKKHNLLTRNKTVDNTIYINQETNSLFTAHMQQTEGSDIEHDQHGHDEHVQLVINPEDDDLDLDTSTEGAASVHGTILANKSPRKRGMLITKTKTLSPQTPKQQKLSVASRLLKQKTPTSRTEISKLPSLLFNDSTFLEEKEKADREVEAAQQMLLHVQWEAEIQR